MTSISAQAVAELRARTGVSILACKQALEEAEGDQEKAIEILRKRGMAQAVKKADRDQSEGAFFIASSAAKAACVQLKCETDFVARSDDFIAIGEKIAKAYHDGGESSMKAEAEALLPAAVQKLGENITLGETSIVEAASVGSYVHSNRKIAVLVGLDSASKVDMAKDVAMHAAAMNPLYVKAEDVPADVVLKEKEIWKEQMKDDKKPAEILEKIMLGKEKKFREENALLKQAFVKDSQKTVEQYLEGAGVSAYVRMSI
jgi:elongation factor Ts